MKTNFSKKIELLLKELNLSQAKFARCLGITPQQVSIWLKGQGYPSVEKLLEIMAFSGKDANYFLCDDIKPTKVSLNNHIIGNNNHNIGNYNDTTIEELKSRISNIEKVVFRRKND